VQRGCTLMSGTLGTAIRCSGFSCRTTSALPSGAAPRHDRPLPLPFAKLVVLMPLDPAIACGAAARHWIKSLLADVNAAALSCHGTRC